jgi:hypothetical protein
MLLVATVPVSIPLIPEAVITMSVSVANSIKSVLASFGILNPAFILSVVLLTISIGLPTGNPIVFIWANLSSLNSSAVKLNSVTLAVGSVWFFFSMIVIYLSFNPNN